MKKREAENYR
uniref:Uncharacterized protein n=1 Tax=Anguilla anguilla TaxID=7936 RepID=A0A0E9R2A3_ANGAN